MKKAKATPARRRRSAPSLDDARWQAILDSAQDAIISIRPSGDITLFNPAAEKMFGYRAEDVLGSNVAVLMPEPFRSEHGEYLRAYAATGEPKAIGRIRHVEGRRSDGNRFPIELSVSEARVGDDVLYTAIIRDVSAREQLEQQLQGERDFARSLVDTAQVIILVVTAKGEISTYNSYLARLAGRELAATVGADWIETFVPPSAGQQARDLFALTLAGRPLIGETVPIFGHDGELRDVQWHGEILYSATGETTGVLLTGLDVTEHLRTQHAIRTREEQQAAIATLGRQALASSRVEEVIASAAILARRTLKTDFVKVLEFVPALQLLRVVAADGWRRPIIGATTGIDATSSHAARTFVQNEPTFLLDRPPEHDDAAELFHQHGVVSGIGVSIAGRGSHPFGVLAAYSAAPRVYSEDDVTFVQSVANTIAEAIARDRAESELLEARRQAQQRDRLADIGAITAKVVHDLGNPLAALSMQAQLLLRRARRGEFEPIEPVIGPVEQCLTTLRRLQDLVKEFNDFARDQQLRRESLAIGDVLEALAELWKPLADGRSIEITVDVDAGLPRIQADSDKLRRVLDNLVKNAIEAIESASGSIEISARPLADGKICIAIADSGSGVPEGTDVFRLFETTKREGTGIGLAVAKQVVQAHGGRIEHRPREPHGTIFEIELPLSGVPEDAVQPLTP